MCGTGKYVLLLFVLVSSTASAQDEPDANDAPAISFGVTLHVTVKLPVLIAL